MDLVCFSSFLKLASILGQMQAKKGHRKRSEQESITISVSKESYCRDFEIIKTLLRKRALDPLKF